jgi:hypothetical protein
MKHTGKIYEIVPLRVQFRHQNPYIKEEQTTQCPYKIQKDKQRSATNIPKTKDRVARTSPKTWGEPESIAIHSSAVLSLDKSKSIILSSDIRLNYECTLPLHSQFAKS